MGWNQVTLRCLILVFYVGHGGRLGLCPKPQQGTCSLHPFFASRRFKVAGVESGDASLPDSCFFMLGVGDVRAAALRLPSPLRGGLKRQGWESGDASLPDSCFFMLGMGTLGLPP